ncbi:competence protein ComEC [Cognatiyoonia koreensis]|uniref:Competence protein ComEC n=2 Tax=Cognatiyoonia koreensis TaxID=364200 RepID=A0A1I0PKJ8_9RHOB|nr:ComEC/Rec2 family competence protein [Cognatiyoonia koreensis]SEW14889.1 competence protein ComEC [Cognatiyoonia koreensis]
MLLCWVPVCLGIGIGVYFSLRIEPGPVAWGAVAFASVVVLLVARKVPTAVAPLCIALALVGCGAGLAKWRTESVAAPVLTFRYYGPVAGRVVNIDRSASDAVRLTLDQVAMDMAPSRTPERVRISVHGDQPIRSFRPGDRLIMTGHLSPPSGPAEPGGFDFQRHAWFAGLGAVGYTRTPVLRSEPADQGWDLWVFDTRMRISQSVRAALPGETGAFAAAIMTGNRAAMSQETLNDLRRSNLAHLLAISGLHMGLLTGFVFAVIRSFVALSPTLALRYPVKKIAAVCAIIVGAGYLALSGGNVATERAFIMVSTMFVAILLDRRALTLRAVAIAATIVLVLRPEALAGPGFQMSFAATTALVAVFRAIRGMDRSLPKWVRAPLSVLVSSAVAGLATAPFAAAHFNQVSHFGLVANVLSVPLMGAVVMPAAVLSVCLAPFGLWEVGLWIMDLGLRWILFVARSVSEWDGAVSYVVAPGSAVLPILTLGLLLMVLWQGKGRFAGMVGVASAFLIWGQTDRPNVLIADNGNLIGVMGSEGRALSRDRGSSFVAGIWLENDGAPTDQVIAAARPGIEMAGRVWRTRIGDIEVIKLAGVTALQDLDGCGGAQVLVSNQIVERPRPCLVLDVGQLRDVGAVALYVQDAGLRIETVRDRVGVRPWNRAGIDTGSIPPTLTLQPRSGPQEQPALTLSGVNQ